MGWGHSGAKVRGFYLRGVPAVPWYGRAFDSRQNSGGNSWAFCMGGDDPVFLLHLSTFSNIRFCVKDVITNMDINLKIFFLQKFSSSSARCHCFHLVTIAIKSLNFQKKKKKKKNKLQNVLVQL